MLANNQFIENRVYEESEEAIAAPVSEPTGGDDNQQDATSKLKSSLNEGLEFIRRILPDVQIEDDSDEEDNIRQALDSCQRENKFLIKKLPPIIGGPEYIRENFVSLFGSRDTSDAIDAMDVFAQNDSSKESDEEHHSEEDIVISSSESEDMFMQPENKLPDAANPKLDNLFSDSSSPEVDALSNSKPKMALSFQDELNRRLLGNKPDSNSSKSDVSTTIAQNSGNVNNLIREQKQNISSDDSGSSASASGFRDRLSNLFANSDESPVPPASKPKPNPQGQIMSDSRQYSAAVANPASAPRKPLDFLSDDDDDEFNIFKTKLSAKEKQKERVSKLFESSDSGSDEAERRDRKGLPAKDSVSRQEPEKEVSDARRSETRHAAQSVQAPAREPLPLNPTASLFSNDDQSSDDDLFTSRVVQLSTPHRTSINSNTKSQVREVSGAIPVSPASTSGPHPANNSDSESSEEMNRSAIANKLEKTIFGNQSRKPVGGISLFGNASSEKKPAKPVSQNMEDISPAAVLPSALETKAGSEIESAVSVRRKSSPKSSDDDMLPATVLKRSVPLSSHVVKSRPKVRNRRRPTRAALKSPSNETDYAMGQSSPDEAARTQLPSEKAVESGSVAESGVVVTDPEAAVSEARKAGSIKSDEKESSRTEPEKKQIPHSGTHQLEAGNLIMNSDPDSQRSNESSKTVSTPITGTKSILSDDSDEELFAATPRRAASNATAARREANSDHCSSN